MTLPWMAERIQLRAIASLRPHAGNARMHDAAQLAQIMASMQAFGFTNPLLVDEDGVLIAGHGRLAAAEALGIAKVPVIVLKHLAPAQKEALRLADNRIAENATWDQALLRDALASVQAAEIDLAALGFSADELAGTARTGKVANDDRADWREAWALFPGDVAYIWHAGVHARTVIESLEAAGFVVRSQIVWAKPRLVLGRGDYHWQHEPCIYGVRKGAIGHWQGARDQTTLWPIGAGDEDMATVHGTQKPVECMRRPMLNNSEPGDVIYEPFCGSGTAIIAAETAERICYAMEIDPGYCDVTIARFEAMTGQPAILDGEVNSQMHHGASLADEAHQAARRKGRGGAWLASPARAFCGGLGSRGREAAMSLREAALTALCARLIASLAARNPAPVIRRNETVPQRLPAGGLVVLRDGESVSETPILSPLAFAIEHRAEIEVLAADNALLDALLVAIANAITADPMLGGAVEWAQPGSADIEDVEFEGAASARAASLPVALFFTATGSPLA
jgi:hypothetical protein